MKLLTKIFLGLLFLVPATAFAAPVSWDFANNILQPLLSGATALVRADHFQATSTTATSTFPRLTSTIANALTLCIGGDCKTAWPSSGTGTVTNIATTYPILGGPITTTGTLSLAFGTTTSNTWGGTQTFTNAPTLSSIASAAGSWLATNGSGTIIATTSPQPAGNYITALTGDVSATGPGSVGATLATVNSNVGSFSNANITVNGKGLITAASSGTGGSGKVATSSSETAGQIPFWTSTSGTPALLSGGSSNFTWDDSGRNLTLSHATIQGNTGTVAFGLNLYGGDSTGTNNAGGSVGITAGDATGGGTSDGGPVNFFAGNPNALGTGGAISFTAGPGGATSGIGGAISFTAGSGIAGNSNGGQLVFNAGSGHGSSDGGALAFNAGSNTDGSGTGNGGTLQFSAGDAGAAGNGTGGDITINAGAGAGIGSNGHVVIAEAPNYWAATLDSTGLSGNHSFTFPDWDGTFIVGSTTSLYQTANGSIGIGTTTPGQSAKLGVTGAGFFSGTVYASNFFDTAVSGNACIGETNGLFGTSNCVSSLASAGSSLTISSPTGNVDASLNLGHSNTWTVAQYFSTLGVGSTTITSALGVQGDGLFSGNLSVANLTATGTITFKGLGAGIGHLSSSGVLSSSAVALGSSDVSGTLGIANGGTASGTAASGLGGLLTGNGTSAINAAAVSGPLTFSSNTLAITLADATHNGYLSSTDWNTFNGKGSGTVTNIAVNSSLTGGPITTTGTLGINLANPNTWTAVQTFNDGATTTSLSVLGTASSTTYIAGAGSNSLPSYTFSADQTTGIYIGGSGGNRLDFTQGGTKAAEITSGALFVAGNISGTSGTAHSFVLDGTAGGPFINTYGFQGDQNTGIYSNTNDNLQFATNGVERLHIDSSGNIYSNGPFAIGSTTPAAEFAIHAIGGTNYPNNTLFSIASSTLTATSTFLSVLNNGTIGIGTTTPSSLLSVQGDGLFSGNLFAANLTATGTITFKAQGTGCATFTAGVLSSTGTACGAGTVTAVSVVSTHGFTGSSSGGATPALTLTTSQSGLLEGDGTSLVGVSGTAGYLPYYSGTNTILATSTIFIGTNSFVGIGTTTPTNPLTISAGTVSIPSVSFGDTATGIFRSALNAIGFTINGVQKMTLTATGLGIASTTPGFVFSVNGTGSDFYITSSGEVAAQDTTNAWNGRLTPTRFLAAQLATTTAWTASSSASSAYGDTMHLTMPFAGQLRNISCTTSAGTLTILANLNSVNFYMANASTTAGTESVTTSFTKGQLLTLTAGSPASSPTYVACTIGATEAP